MSAAASPTAVVHRHVLKITVRVKPAWVAGDKPYDQQRREDLQQALAEIVPQLMRQAFEMARTAA